jgi:oxygen-independent coproporphyrinogen-3 oxidase
MMKNTTLDVDLGLLEHYDTSGPRYTSYPSARQFNEEVGADAFRQQIVDGHQDNDISLYIHIPFCPNRCLFCGCHTFITRNREKIQSYLRDLYREIRRLGDLLPDDRSVGQVHWGGGTPSYLKPDEIRALMDEIRSSFSLKDDAEVGVELDPRGMSVDQMRAFEEAGFNRVSIGVQDFDPDVQEAIKRKQSADETGRVIHWARKSGMNSVNFDLIYGLPHQTPETFQKTLDRILDFNPDRMAVYNYAHVPWMKPHQKGISEQDLPEPRTKLRLLKQSVETLTGAGYRFIGMDHFAKPDDELSRAQENGTLHRNFQGYSTRAGLDLFGLGVSGISTLDDLYVQNVKSLSKYRSRMEREQLATFRGYELTEEDRLRKRVIMELMCNLALDKREIEDAFDVDFNRHFRSERQQLSAFEQDGLIDQSPDRIRIRPEGRLVIRNICMTFDEYIRTEDEEERATGYSRTV